MNSRYNLMNQLIQEQKSVWRIEKHYLKETETEMENKLFSKILKDKQEYILALETLILESLKKEKE